MADNLPKLIIKKAFEVGISLIDSRIVLFLINEKRAQKNDELRENYWF